ncbi:hypothetical protein QKT49_gp058 [Acanthamoeba castellanii medusavirus]|uniref:Uncharacterized protein n=1 Tax=Acanthamoeba castellanii medusavirus J1 TaxID=3114988 RepID=A0A3T1CWJ8_9VIRU|nr:hypothetical protein QKT49_gp058 [Acanthamoeba castellanii medusavirus]BBI30198.1 hypothetical protein [Acanthamoeba castellanii medusavirus J1]
MSAAGSPSRKRTALEEENVHAPAALEESPKKRRKSDTCVAPGIDSDLLRRAQELCAAGGIPCHGDTAPATETATKKQKKKSKKTEEIKKEKVKAVVTAAVAAALAKSKAAPAKKSPVPAVASKQVQRVVDQFFRRLLKVDEPNRRAISGGQREPSEQEIQFHKKLVSLTKSYRTDFMKQFGDELGLDLYAIERDVLGKGVAPARRSVAPPSPESESESEDEDGSEEEEEEEETAIEPHSSESEESESDEEGDASGEAESSEDESESESESESEDA